MAILRFCMPSRLHPCPKEIIRQAARILVRHDLDTRYRQWAGRRARITQARSENSSRAIL
jgi:hypothetical protein